MRRPLPITIVTGFLGAGKTSVLHHFLSEMAAEPVVFFVEANGPLNLDARQLRGLSGAMSRPRDQILDLDSDPKVSLLPQLGRMAEEGVVSEVVIEISGLETPFLPAGLLTELAADQLELRQVICVVDALEYFHEVVMPGSTTGRSVSGSLQVAQVESADLIVLNKCDLVAERERNRCVESLCEINPAARWLETTHGGLPREAWKLTAPRKPLKPSAPKKTGFSLGRDGLQNLIFVRYRPFHPERFWQWFQAEHPGLPRVKGIFWLATRNLLVGGLSRTARQSSCGAAGVWWAALPREEWPQDEPSLQAMHETWSEPYGDRRQELALIGNPEAVKAAEADLEKCLLTNEEFSRPPEQWKEMPDPFPGWDLAQDQD